MNQPQPKTWHPEPASTRCSWGITNSKLFFRVGEDEVDIHCEDTFGVDIDCSLLDQIQQLEDYGFIKAPLGDYLRADLKALGGEAPRFSPLGNRPIVSDTYEKTYILTVKIKNGANEDAVNDGIRLLCDTIDYTEFHDGGGDVRFVGLEDGHDVIQMARDDGEIRTITLVSLAAYENSHASYEQLNKEAARRFGQEAADRVFPIK